MNGGSPREGEGDVSSRDNIEMSSSTGISDHCKCAVNMQKQHSEDMNSNTDAFLLFCPESIGLSSHIS